MGGGVEEVRVAKTHVLGTHLNQLGNVPQDGGFVDYPDSPVIDGRDRAVPTPVAAAMAGLDITGLSMVATNLEMGIAVQGRQVRTGGNPESGLAEFDDPGNLPGLVPPQRIRPFHQMLFVLS